MLFDKTIKVELFASKDETRSYLCHPFLDVATQRLVATDGHRMIVTPVADCSADHSGPITAAALVAARKASTKHSDPQLTANGLLALPDGSTLPRPEAERFPPFEKVIPKPGKADRTVGVSAKYLASVFAAVGDRNVAMTVAGEKDPITFRFQGALGETVIVIMPTRL